MVKLTDSKIKAAKARAKLYRLSDGQGLRLQVNPTGHKSFQLKYRIDKREYTASLGAYPEVGLASARERALAARALVDKGVHPLAHKKAQLAEKAAAEQNTFGAVISAWMGANKNSWAPYTFSQVRSSMTRYILGNKALASKPIRDVQPKDIRVVLQSIVQRTELKDGERKKSGSVTIARNVRTWCSGVFDFAIERDLTNTNPIYPLRNLTELKRPAGAVKHNKKLSPSELKQLLTAIDSFSATRQTGIAIELLLLFFVRTGELRQAQWSEFDLNAKQWRIPASRMKAKKPHLVPISKQALKLLKEQRSISGTSGWAFPNQRRPEACLNATTINRALERMGLNGPGTIGLAAHGFRGTASTHLHELEFPPEIIEIQLAHSERNKVKATYNEAKFVNARTKMMQAWADHLDTLRTDGSKGSNDGGHTT